MTTIQMTVTRDSTDEMGNIDYSWDGQVTVTGDVTPFRRGRYTGPPEDCYPNEGGEVDITSVTCDGQEFELTASEEDEARDLLRQAFDAENEREDLYDD